MPVLRGELVVGELVMLAVERHYRDLQTAAARGLRFSSEHAWHVIDYIEKWFHHIKGALAGEPIRLDPWQKFWTAVLYGWRRLDGDAWLRRFTRGYEEVARKNGKSTWKGPQGAYLWMMDGEPGAEVYAVATTREQAMTVFKPAFENVKRWRRQSSKLRDSIRVFEGLNQERLELGSSLFRPLASNADAQDGYNPSAVLYDELHAQKSREQWDVLESGFGARMQPLLSAITTAGFILDGICTEIRTYLVSVLKGQRQDDSFFGYIYTLDDGDDVFDERNWIKANPGLGRSKTLAYMRDMARKAKALPSALANFKTKDLNLWCNDAEGWIDLAVWDKGKRAVHASALAGRKCYGGLDLASVRDLTAFVLVFPPIDGEMDWQVLVWVWCPSAKLEAEADDAAPYKRWAAEGWLTATEGDVTDYGPVRETVLEACQTFEVESIGFDVWNAQQLSNELLAEDVPLVEIPQNTGGMYPGAKKLEELVYSKRLRHGGNPVLRWCAGNVALLYDTNGNFRPDKKRSKKNGRIDPIVATVMALSRAVGVEPEEQEPGILLL
ncbi:terminase large subunit [Thauera phenylacetica]|uniref:terminase large subunit n=1 Tax=Thauera phenylacetica TaxID=164400 RepID=UPI0039E5F050